MVVVDRKEDSYGLNTVEWLDEIVRFYGDERDKQFWKEIKEYIQERQQEDVDILAEQNSEYDAMIARSINWRY